MRQITKHSWMSRGLVVAAVTGVLLFCLQHQIDADIAGQRWDRLLVRVLLVVTGAVLAAIRIPPLPLREPYFLRRLAVLLFFFSIMFFPVVSQFSDVSRHVEHAKSTITSQYSSKVTKAYALLQQFPREFNNYVKDSFQLSELFINLDAILKVYVLHVSPNNNVAVGKNGFYFEGWGTRKVEKGIIENFDNIADYMGQMPFSEEDLHQWRRILEERKYWLKERGSEYVFILAPTKAMVYPEYLPSSLRTATKTAAPNRFQQLSGYLEKYSDINFINLLPPLLKAKEKRDYPFLFYKTDFHWNFYGAFMAYQAIMDRLREMYPQYGLVHPEFNEFTLSVNRHWAHHRFIKMVGLPEEMQKKEHYITMVPRPGGRWDSALDLPEKGIYDVYPPIRQVTDGKGHSLGLRLIRNPKGKIPSLLLLGDSFFEKCVYFFSADAQEVMNDRTVVNFPANLFRYVKPTIVAQEILNMFILRKPPENPPGFAEAWLRGKFADLSSRTFLTVGRGNPGFILQGPDFASFEPESEAVRILRIFTESSVRKVNVLLLGNDGQTKGEAVVQRDGDNYFYFELPSVPFHSLEIKSNSERPLTGKIFAEVRTEEFRK